MEQGRKGGTLAAFAVVTTLFFAWGFITSLNDPVVTAVKGIFCLTDFRAQLSAFAFFIAYGVMSFPAAVLLARRKSIPTILIAFATMIAGCLLMLAAANFVTYGLVLLGLFVLAGGITILQVAANPLAASLGDPRYSHFRLTFSQAFNSLGTFIGPWLGAVLFLKGVETKACEGTSQAARLGSLAGIDRAYFWICALIAALALFFVLFRRVVSRAAPAPSRDAERLGVGGMFMQAWSSPWARLGGAAIFLYVGAEVSIGTQMAFFLHSDAIWGRSDAPFAVPLLGHIMGSDGVPGVSAQEAGKAVALYWGGAMVGRIAGSLLLARVSAARLLAAFAAIAAAMCLYVVLVGGVGAGYVALAIGLFNSIMFPVIFTLTLERSTAGDEATSGFLCTAIIGGALVPPLVGAVSGVAGYATALIVPAACYALLCLFALSARRAPVRADRLEPAATIH
ncbi:MAG: MFS transporter [Alphaproteobacteria bacterium]|nr:MFS transporter [Alphaproteobacteria bacterium]MBV9370121.1 MFS transporter [Alphaproteobacteria bacterium]MBV9901461.1 MFS transporter [Alphaproteobacteria bacterium]